MKIAFLGSGEFGLPTLKRLTASHEVVCVVTSKDKTAGRNRKPTATAIGQWASEQNLLVIKTSNVNDPEILKELAEFHVDAMVVIAFGQKLSDELLSTQRTMNLHASLLPRWRGAAPIHAAVSQGDRCSGVSVITLAQKMDAGLVLGQVSTAIGETETAGELHDRLALLGPDLVLDVLSNDDKGEVQDEALVTYAPKLSRDDAVLDLNKDAVTVARTIRGLSPWPCCHLQIAGVDCKILNAIAKNGIGSVGEVLEDGTIATGSGSIEILEMKPAGSKAMTWKDFCNGRAIQVGCKCEVSQ
ncbi:MAG: methionyl-tRNA formyltransferase [Planctomycetes bacterium]|nr:methionyl-tRNA formyltransferase [Planctomycetota bacterium]